MNFEKTVFNFLKELHKFDYSLSCIDLVWDFIFPNNKGRWFHVGVTKYKETYYISHIDGDTCGLEAVPHKSVKVMDSMGFSSYEKGQDDPARVWMPLILAAQSWFKKALQDWPKLNRRVIAEYPLNRRYGIVPHSLIRLYLSDIYRVDQALGKKKCQKFIRLVEEGYFLGDKNTIVKTMCANDFFDYCRIAYIAGQRKGDSVDKKLSGKEMYKRYADGRHEGLLDINHKSKKEFADWIDGTHPKKSSGGHPWEIKRGGNTTHINLSVHRPSFYQKEDFKIELCGAAISRLTETIQMFLAIQEASKPISISDPEGIRRRLLAQDNIGIIPSYSSLHRANQRYREDQHVYDVFHYDELGRHKRKILPFITWEALPILKSKDI
jgi:hypothetical protein